MTGVELRCIGGAGGCRRVVLLLRRTGVHGPA
jgi:hypothetical protein